jgi:DNA-binding PadR family transcriptional regulator
LENNEKSLRYGGNAEIEKLVEQFSEKVLTGLRKWYIVIIKIYLYISKIYKSIPRRIIMRESTEEQGRGPWFADRAGMWQGHHGHGGPRGPHGGPGWGRQRGGHRGGPRGFWGGFPGGEGNDNWEGFFGGHPGPGGRERLERGVLRYIILNALKDGPKHGYEIIKQLEERTQGRYSPSPGTLYPTLQYLEDLGLVRSDQEGDRRVYNITDDGRAELEKQNDVVNKFWSRFQNRGQGPNMMELKFAGDALKDLLRTVGMGLRSGAFSADTETIRKVRQSLENCQNEIRAILSQSASDHTGAEGEQKNSDETSSGAGTVQF